MTTAPCFIRLRRLHAKRQGIESAQRIVEAPLRLGRDLEGHDALCERGEYRLGLEPGHRLADTAVNAGAECHVPGRAPADVELVGPLPAARIAIGGGEEQQNLLPLTQSHACNIDSFRRRTEERLHRRLEPQHFLECETY